MARLAGKAALITGATGGIGAAVSRLFAREGARLVLIDRDDAALARLAREIGADAIHLAADVTKAADVERGFRLAADRLGGVDVILANAGVLGAMNPIVDYPDETFDDVIAVNLRGVWLTLKHGMRAMAKRGGSIVVTSSTAGVRGSVNLSAYVASKHAVVGLVRTAAQEGAPLGIRVNSVNPSPIDTPMVRELEAGTRPGAPDQAKEALTCRIPLRRYGTPEEVAKLMLFLASDESSFCTGGIYMIDGGRSA
jgi:NAD(P)-dependent dehydrogenase (short-subunit alcohol dehydrogenase family)